MPKNEFLAKQRAIQEECFNEGLQIGRQQFCDMLALALRNSEIMGKDVMSGKRIVPIQEEIIRLLDIYALAWRRHDEADYWQSQLDGALKEAYGSSVEPFYTFHERYPLMYQYDYTKGKWK